MKPSKCRKHARGEHKQCQITIISFARSLRAHRRYKDEMNRCNGTCVREAWPTSSPPCPLVPHSSHASPVRNVAVLQHVFWQPIKAPFARKQRMEETFAPSFLAPIHSKSPGPRYSHAPHPQTYNTILYKSLPFANGDVRAYQAETGSQTIEPSSQVRTDFTRFAIRLRTENPLFCYRELS